MSGRHKKQRDKLAAKVLDGKITVNAARGRLGWEPLRGAAPQRQQQVTKAAAPEKRKVNPAHQALFDAGPAAMNLWHARQVLKGAAAEPRDPLLRARAEAAARKGLT
jgi:hypothetical protein